MCRFVAVCVLDSKPNCFIFPFVYEKGGFTSEKNTKQTNQETSWSDSGTSLRGSPFLAPLQTCGIQFGSRRGRGLGQGRIPVCQYGAPSASEGIFRTQVFGVFESILWMQFPGDFSSAVFWEKNRETGYWGRAGNLGRRLPLRWGVTPGVRATPVGRSLPSHTRYLAQKKIATGKNWNKYTAAPCGDWPHRKQHSCKSQQTSQIYFKQVGRWA